jgi:hypothetical protein
MANLLCEHWELFSETWQTSGWMRNGQVFELRMPGPHTTDSEFLSSPIPEESKLRTPSVTDSTGGAISEKQAREKNRMVKVADQAAELAHDNGLKVTTSIALSLMPTPNTMDYLPARTAEQKEKNKGKGGYANVRETVVNDLLRTPNAMDGDKGSYPTATERLEQGRQVNLHNEVNELMGTPQARDYKGRPGRQEDKNLNHDVARQDLLTNWGKFEPAIKRWEGTLGRPAPAPTKPDGKEGAHRLSSAFTEWMMGVPEGWITDCGLSRNDELKACGNGVVPQQAELALKVLLQGITIPAGGGASESPNSNS